MIKRVIFDQHGNIQEVEFWSEITVQNAMAEIEEMRHRMVVINREYPISETRPDSKESS